MKTKSESINKNSSNYEKQIILRIQKYNPLQDKKKKFLDFKLQSKKWTTVLDLILEVKKNHNDSIAVRYSCRQATCGSCGMKINGRPRLACFTKVSDLESNIIKVEPMDNFPIVRDLVVNFEKFFTTHKKIKPFIIRNDSEDVKDKEFLQTPEELDKYIQFANCIKCGLCNSVCPTMAIDSSFIGPQALAQAFRYIADNRDQAKDTRLRIIDEPHGVWRCHFPGSCSQVCPKGVDPAMGIQLLQAYLLGFK